MVEKTAYIIIRPIRLPDEIPAARRLIFEIANVVYEKNLPLEEAIVVYEGKGWLREMLDIQKNFFNNGGTFLVSVDGERLVGTGAIRFLEPGVCELKRLWLLPEYHKLKLGYRMLVELMNVARKLDYQQMRLTTSEIYQKQALNFYRKMGFHDCPMFDPNHDPGEVALEIEL